VDADAETPAVAPLFNFGVVGHMQAQHAEPDVRPDQPRPMFDSEEPPLGLCQRLEIET